MRYRFAILLLLLFGACGGGDGDRSRITLRIVHAVPDGPSVDIWVVGRNSRLFNDLSFATATGFVSLEPGTYNFRARLTGDPRSAPYIAESGDVDLGSAGGKTVTVVIAGLASTPEPAPEDPPNPDSVHLDVYVHDFAKIDNSFARVRLVHAAVGLPKLDLTLVDSFPGGEVEGEFLGLEPYTASDAAGLAVDVNDEEQLTLANGETMEPLTSFTTVGLPAGGEFFLIFLGTPQAAPLDPVGLAALLIDKDGGSQLLLQNPRLYFVNTVVDATSVDVSLRALDTEGMAVDPSFPVDTELLYGDLGGALGASVVVAPGAYEFSARMTGSETDIGAQVSPVLEAGRQYLVTIGGRNDGTWPFLLNFVRDDFDVTNFGTATENRWRLVHSAPDLTAVFFGRNVNQAFEALPQFPDSIEYGGTSAPEAGSDIGLDPFTLMIVRQNMEDQYGEWDIVPLADAYEFVLLLGSIEIVENGPKLAFIDTTTQPWTISEQYPNGVTPPP